MYLAGRSCILVGMHSGERWRLGHRPGLDGLRGVAILLVLASHGGVPGVDRAGAVGVGLFFTLSGFLIATLLLEEGARTGRVSIGNFYRRRALRLLPALFLMLAFVTAANTVLPGFTHLRSQLGSLLYFNNWVRAFDAPAGVDALAHTWSLSIEEQFYLVVPFVVIALRRRPRTLIALCLGASLFAVIERLVMVYQAHGHSTYRSVYGTDARMDSLLLGVALAAAFSIRNPALGAPARAGLAAVGVFGIVLTTSHAIPFAVFDVAAATVVAVAAIALIAVVLSGRTVFASSVLVWFGKRSYGLYLWHYPLIKLAIRTGAPWVVVGPVTILVAVGVAAASYRWVEQPFLRLRHPVPGRSTERVDGADAVPIAIH
jgi:peptidoglycan/LPS O-acetylase OafA/YrhL